MNWQVACGLVSTLRIRPPTLRQKKKFFWNDKVEDVGFWIFLILDLVKSFLEFLKKPRNLSVISSFVSSVVEDKANTIPNLRSKRLYRLTFCIDKELCWLYMNKAVLKRMQQELTWSWYCFGMSIQINQLGFGKEVDDAKKVAPFG